MKKNKDMYTEKYNLLSKEVPKGKRDTEQQPVGQSIRFLQGNRRDSWTCNRLQFFDC